MLISKDVARRFLLGRQGLWPGRRWRSPGGTERAMRTMENVQLDPLQVVARAQDLALASRVVDYRPDDWATLTYERRRFFEWGGWLALRPIDELPYFRVLMRRSRSWGRMATLADDFALGPAIEEMRRLLREGRELSNRSFSMDSRSRVDTYRSRKDSGLALHYLWRVGEAMVTRRERFERVYARPESVVPARFLAEAGETEAEDYLLLKDVAAAGLSRLTGVNGALHRDIRPAEVADWRDRKLADGELIEVIVEGHPGRHVALASDGAALEAMAAGRIPRGWRPLETSTSDEATFLSPLDPVIGDRGRLRRLFDFDYKWEVYDKAENRRYGYYVLPILWGDRLVARFDAKLDRPTMTLVINGFWLEDAGLATDEAFADAVARGMIRFLAFLGAVALDARTVPQPAIRRRLDAARTALRDVDPL
jgi:uncharacterized protein YcaQ